MAKEAYKWTYSSVGGVVRVKITCGEDIAHLDELDQKKWTVLSCPVEGLDFDSNTLRLIDTDGDGKIRVCEVVAAAKWLTAAIKDKDMILAGDDVLPLSQIDTTTDEGKMLYSSAKQILSNLGVKSNEISLAQASDSVAIFAQTKFNGDGIITPASADDEGLKGIIENAVSCIGGIADRSGGNGVDADKIESFYGACSDFAAWTDAGKEKGIFPYGADTEGYVAACKAVSGKVADYFVRCKLVAFNPDAESAVDVSVARIGEIADRNLNECAEEIAKYPLARPDADAVLKFDRINPAWQAAFSTIRTIPDFKGKKGITEEEWNAVLAKFTAYEDWKASKKGAEVEGLGYDAVTRILKENRKAELLALVAKDVEVKAESESIDAVAKLLYLYRDFAKLLRNFVVFSDFYGRNDSTHAIFEAGKLYIDERCCNLCIKVANNGNHSEAAGLGGMFLIYCNCTSKKLGKSQEILAVMTDGGIKNLRPGKNAIFYDLEGNDWDAVVTKIVDNPISIKQAFFAPYRKLSNFISEKISKNAAEKDNLATSELLSTADNIDLKAKDQQPKAPFDIAKFAGIFAALGMALGMIGSALASLARGVAGIPVWQTLLILLGLMLVISGPSCFLAWSKLRKRNLGPILNANGWAINSAVLINIMFGATLTSTAKYPIIKSGDPFKKKGMGTGKKILIALLVIAVIAVALWIISNRIGRIF